MNRYFDLHFHPAFKPYLSDNVPKNRKNCWKRIHSPIGVVRSQGCLDQAKEGQYGIGVATFITLERPLTSSFLIDHLAPKLTFMDEDVLDFPNYADFFQRFKDRIELLKANKDHDPDSGRTFKLINSISEYDPNQINLILAIEGGHNLEGFNSLITENFKEIKQGDDRFLYLTLVHMTQYPLASHAYGMKLIKKNDQFKSLEFGITDLGKEMIDIAYDESIGPKIFIDIKHMSLVARHEFYKYRKEKGYDNIPILATHMGVTGISKDPKEIVKLFSKPAKRRGDFVEINYDRPRGIGRGLIKKTHFNPWSINLYDEDIVEILNSGGLIGLNLDQRILGSQSVKGEFFNVGELNYILNNYQHPSEPQAFMEGEFTDETGEKSEFNEQKHLRHLCNNILHIIKVGGTRAWEQLCIGSDFDGLINPINYCENAAEFPKLEKGLVETLPEMMEEDKDHDYEQVNIEEKVRGIMFENAVHFLQTHFI